MSARSRSIRTPGGRDRPLLVVDDFGFTLNPLLLDGQVHGGIAQGAGQALMEGAFDDAEGQLLTASLMDYTLPRADDLPHFDFETRNVPSTTNPMGLKGAGEAGTIGSTPAVMNAVADALWRAYRDRPHRHAGDPVRGLWRDPARGRWTLKMGILPIMACDIGWEARSKPGEGIFKPEGRKFQI